MLIFQSQGIFTFQKMYFLIPSNIHFSHRGPQMVPHYTERHEPLGQVNEIHPNLEIYTSLYTNRETGIYRIMIAYHFHTISSYLWKYMESVSVY